MSSLYSRIVKVESNMHVAVDWCTSPTIKFHAVFRHTLSHIDIKRRTEYTQKYARSNEHQYLRICSTTRMENPECSGSEFLSDQNSITFSSTSLSFMSLHKHSSLCIWYSASSLIILLIRDDDSSFGLRGATISLLRSAEQSPLRTIFLIVFGLAIHVAL